MNVCVLFCDLGYLPLCVWVCTSASLHVRLSLPPCVLLLMWLHLKMRLEMNVSGEVKLVSFVCRYRFLWCICLNTRVGYKLKPIVTILIVW